MSRARTRRWLARGVLVLVSIPLLWLATINLALWTGLVEQLVSGERPRSTVRLRHGFAWCVWPTHVHFHELRLQIDAARWQLELDLPDGEVELELSQLLARRFATRSVQGQHAQLAFAFKRPYGTDPAQLEGLRRIEGFPLPILDEEPRPTPEHPWEFVLEGVDTELDQLQVDTFTAQLQGHLGGAFVVRVAERVGLPSLTLDMTAGEIHHRETLVARDVASQVELSVRAYDVRELHGTPALRMMSGRVAIQAAISELEWVNDLGWDVPVTLHHGQGTLGGEVIIDEGAVAPGSSLIYQAARLELTQARERGRPLLVDAAIVVEVRAEATDGEEPAVLAQAELVALRLGAASPLMTADQLSLRAGFDSVDLVDGLGKLVSASVELPAFEVDVREVGRLGPKLPLRGGSVVGHASAHTKRDDPRIFELDFAATVDDLVLTLGDDFELRTDGDLRSKGTLEHAKLALVLAPLHVKLHQIALRTARAITSHDWLVIEGATVRYDAGSGRLVADLDGRMNHLRSVVLHLRPDRGLFRRVPDLRRWTEPVSFSMKVTRGRGGTEVDIGRFEGKAVDLRATISRAGDATRAAVYFTRARVGLSTSGGESRDIDVAVGPRWFEERQAWVRAALER